MSFTITVAETGSVAIGVSCGPKVLTGQASSPAGTAVGTASTTPSLAVTPNATGSLVYFANLGLTGTYTPNAATVYQHNTSGNGLEYIQGRSTTTTTAATPVTLGGAAGVNSISFSAFEVKAGTGLAEDGSSPPGTAVTNANTVTTAAFTPPGGSLIVVPVTTNGGAGVTNVTVSDTSGLSLTWAEHAPQHAAGNGYAGVWSAYVPAARTATASLTVTPSRTAAAARGHSRTASLTVTPSFTVSQSHVAGGTATAAATHPYNPLPALTVALGVV